MSAQERGGPHEVATCGACLARDVPTQLRPMCEDYSTRNGYGWSPVGSVTPEERGARFTLEEVAEMLEVKAADLAAERGTTRDSWRDTQALMEAARYLRSRAQGDKP